MKIKAKIALAGVAASLAVAIAPGVGVASADEAYRVGPGEVGIFDDINYWKWLGTRTPFFWLENVSSGANDRMSSWINRSNYRNSWWEDANGGGFCHPMVPQYWAAAVWAEENDKLSSWGTNNNAQGC